MSFCCLGWTASRGVDDGVCESHLIWSQREMEWVFFLMLLLMRYHGLHMQHVQAVHKTSGSLSGVEIDVAQLRKVAFCVSVSAPALNARLDV